MNSIWMNLGIEEYNFIKLARLIISVDEYPVRAIPKTIYLGIQGKNDSLKIPRFHCLTKAEETDILGGNWDKEKNYENEFLPYGFYFPNCKLKELKYFLPGGFDEIIDEKLDSFFWENNCLIFNKQLLYRAVFIILHEYGHYLSYKKYSFDKEKYARFVYDSKQEFYQLKEKLQKKNEISKEDEYQYKLKYRNCEDEKEADDFALANIENTVQMIIEQLKTEHVE